MQYAYLAVKRLFDEFLNTHARERTLLFVIDIKTPVVRLALYLVWAVFLSCHNNICFLVVFPTVVVLPHMIVTPPPRTEARSDGLPHQSSTLVHHLYGLAAGMYRRYLLAIYYDHKLSSSVSI